MTTPPKTDFDVLIVGAGISSASAPRITSRPSGRARLSPYWRGGIRSAEPGACTSTRAFAPTSDMPTFGYGFKPWTHRKAIADGHIILDYPQQTIDEFALGEHIRFGHKVHNANFDTAHGRWTLTSTHPTTGQTTTFTSRFLFLGTGYYDYDNPFIPEFAGREDFDGQVVHPQHWPVDLDYTGKRVVVIGSGATAVTLIPSMADRNGPHHDASALTQLRLLDSGVRSDRQCAQPDAGPQAGVQDHPQKNVALGRGLFKACERWPKLMRKLLIGYVRHAAAQAL